MKLPSSLPLSAWMIAPACACGLLICIVTLRIQHLDFLLEAAGAPVESKAGSPTGFAGGVRRFVPGSRDMGSFEIIEQTQQMLETGNWRVRHVDYDNAPEGREVVSASPYRWWLALVSVVHSTLTGDPVGASVERAAVFADPLIHLVLVAGSAFYIARRFGTLAGALGAFCLALLFPFAGSFMPGQPRNDVLAAAAAFWSILPLLEAGLRAARPVQLNRAYLIAGGIGGFALWLDPSGVTPIIAGVALSGLAVSFLTRKTAPATGETPAPPWRLWAVGGASVCLAAFVLEFLPGNAPDIRLDVISPVHGIAWLGAGELLARAQAWSRRESPVRIRREIVPVVLALAALVVPLVIAFRSRDALFGPDPSLLRLSPLVESSVAANAWSLVSREGFSAATIAAFLPLFLLVPLILQIVRKTEEMRHRVAALIALGPVFVTLVVAAVHMGRWTLLDAALIGGLVACTMALSSRGIRSLRGGLLAGGAAAALLSGGIVLAPWSPNSAVDETELASLIERDLAHWLSGRAGEGRVTVLASPNLSASLAFEGGFRSLGSPFPENRTGFELSLRIAGTSSQDEAYALVQKRQITHVVLASWDPALEEFAKLGDKDDKSLAALLHKWQPPRWLRPVAYPVPQIAGVEAPVVLVFEVVELQDNSVAMSSLAEYFVEAGQPALAAQAADALGRMFPNDLGAQVARARASIAVGDMGSATEAFDEVQRQLGSGAAQILPWDRRVSLAILLADAKRFDLVRVEIEKVISDISEDRVRSLSPLSLYRFAGLIKTLGLKPGDSRMTALVRELIPAERRPDF